MSKASSGEWLEAPAESDWVEVQAEGSAEGRGMGVLDMARAVRSGAQPRAGADLAIHVLDIMESIARSAESGQTIPVSTTCKPVEPLPVGWNPIERST